MSSSGSSQTLVGAGAERYEYGHSGKVSRVVTRRDGSLVRSHLTPNFPVDGMSADQAFDLTWLRSTRAPRRSGSAGAIRSVDLFAGCGGLSIGIGEAARALGLRLEPVLANDIDPAILGVYSRNTPEAEALCAPIEALLDGPCGGALTSTERRFARRVGEIDLVVGGPPCQGHSDFNNHTRNDDPKNELYLRMARFCEVIEPRHVIIENVPGVERDKRRVAQRTWEHLSRLGYSVDSGIVDTSRLGVAQRRRRSITIASREIGPSVPEAVEAVETKPRPLEWAISDLLGIRNDRPLDRSPSVNDSTRRRIDYLFDNDLFELPDSERPDCHRLKDHSYVSVYGRLHWDRPAPTITTGFGTMGRGRFVHPSERRTLTPHEAARIQFFPDFFDFGDATRNVIHTVIGNAVPPKMGYALGLHLFR